MTLPIYRMFDGRHIDIDRILEISPAEVLIGDTGVSFSIQYQLRDKPVWYRYTYNNWDSPGFLRNLPGMRLEGENDWNYRDRMNKLAVAVLQAKVDEVIKVWNEWRLREINPRA